MLKKRQKEKKTVTKSGTTVCTILVNNEFVLLKALCRSAIELKIKNCEKKRLGIRSSKVAILLTFSSL